jgi:hypothetical protein
MEVDGKLKSVEDVEDVSMLDAMNKYNICGDDVKEAVFCSLPCEQSLTKFVNEYASVKYLK